MSAGTRLLCASAVIVSTTLQVQADHVIKLKFEDVGKLPPPVLQFQDVTFGYSPDKVLYSHVDLGADLDSRVRVDTGTKTIVTVCRAKLLALCVPSSV
jgi:ATPase subunit of ABC transporter with duplicated ATPase domains